LYKFETDITGFFDAIPHYNLLLILSTEFGVEDEILDLLSECFNAWSGTKESSTPGVGIPQGPLPSFLLANLLLHPLDKQVIGEAFKYYRYMDDINIYGYSEEELLDILVMIDNYLKGNGLSINSKKTRIEKIDETKEDSTVENFKRLEILVKDYDVTVQLVDNPSIAESNSLDKDISLLFDQTNEELIDNTPEIISDPDEIIKFWEGEIQSVEEELPSLFTRIDGLLSLKDEKKTDDIDFIRLSSKYGTALGAIQEFKLTEANPDLLEYWLFAFRKYFWRAKNYIITLQYYRNNKTLKKALTGLYSHGKNYEQYRYYIVTCLTYNFNHTDKELRDFFKLLKAESSDLVKYAWYCLLIKKSKDRQLHTTVKSNLSNETSEYLKLIVLDYWKYDNKRLDSMHDLINSVGL
jgi:hypothetical protein